MWWPVEFLEPDVHDISDRYAFKIHSQVGGPEMFVLSVRCALYSLCVAADAPVLCCYVSHNIVSSFACSRRFGVATDLICHDLIEVPKGGDVAPNAQVCVLLKSQATTTYVDNAAVIPWRLLHVKFVF